MNVKSLERMALLAVLTWSAASFGGELTPIERQLASEVKNLGWVVFAARADQGDWDLFLMRPDGSDRRPLTHTPEWNEGAPQFSRDGKKLLYRRLPKNDKFDGNHYGASGQLVLSDSDGSNATALGEAGEFPWASWSPDGKQLACLGLKGITLIDVATKKPIRTLPRQGFFQQITWSPDGEYLIGVANNFGTGWSIARMNLVTGKVNAVSKVDCCTPDWFPDGKSVVFSKRPGHWTQLWMGQPDGQSLKLLYAEHGRHIYGGHVSPDGKYVLFTGNMEEDGDPSNAGAPMGLMRLADAPIVGGDTEKLRQEVPQFRTGPLLKLPTGWEPCWTSSESPAGRVAEKPTTRRTP